MSPATRTYEQIVSAATATLTQDLQRLHEALVGLAQDRHAVLLRAANPPSIPQMDKVGVSPFDTFDALRALEVELPSAPLKRFHFVEDEVAITRAFLAALEGAAPGTGPRDILTFDVVDRHTGRAVAVALPPVAFDSLSDQLNLKIREIERERKKLRTARRRP